MQYDMVNLMTKVPALHSNLNYKAAHFSRALVNSVNIIFHSAATIRFNEKLSSVKNQKEK